MSVHVPGWTRYAPVGVQPTVRGPRAQESRFFTPIPVPSDHFSDRKLARWSKRLGFRRTLPLLGYIVRRVVT